MTHQVIKNTRAIARAAGTDLNRAVKTTIFLTDMPISQRSIRSMPNIFLKPCRHGQLCKWRLCPRAERSRWNPSYNCKINRAGKQLLGVAVFYWSEKVIITMEYTVKDILKLEVAPALGCTEPVAIALGAATAAGVLPKKAVAAIEIWVSPNIYKNGLAVAIPGTGGVRAGYGRGARRRGRGSPAEAGGFGIHR